MQRLLRISKCVRENHGNSLSMSGDERLEYVRRRAAGGSPEGTPPRPLSPREKIMTRMHIPCGVHACVRDPSQFV